MTLVTVWAVGTAMRVTTKTAMEKVHQMGRAHMREGLGGGVAEGGGGKGEGG